MLIKDGAGNIAGSLLPLAFNLPIFTTYRKFRDSKEGLLYDGSIKRTEAMA